MKRSYKIGLILVILSIAVFSVYSNEYKKEEFGVGEGLNLQENPVQEVSEDSKPVGYFSPGDKIMIDVGTQNLYTGDVTSLTYYALDSSNNPVYFREKDRAFVRILGVTHLFTNNTEIFHPEVGGAKDYTIFSGNLSILEPGTYLIKVCLGENINLNNEGAMVWPWGCFEDHTSVEMNVYAKRN